MVFLNFSGAISRVLGSEPYQASYCSYFMYKDSLKVGVGGSASYYYTIPEV